MCCKAIANISSYPDASAPEAPLVSSDLYHAFKLVSTMTLRSHDMLAR
jgi:hypothetical protein